METPEAGCPLCGSDRCSLALSAYGRDYLSCRRCGLLFVPPEFHLSPEDEKARYLTHRNSPHEEGYRAFLGTLTDCLTPRLKPAARGLDYGSGPGPALLAMLNEAGFSMRDYDPFFNPDEEALGETYDFVTCTETAEHFRKPLEEFARMGGLLKPGGLLGVMTKMPDPEMPLMGWSYLRDETHVSIYSKRSMRWIAGHFGWRLEFPARNVVLFFL